MIDNMALQTALQAGTEMAFAAARANHLPGTFEIW